MATCTPTALAADAVCLTCLDDHTLLASIAKSLCTISGMSCEPSTLAADAKCFTCLSHGQLLSIIAKLLCDISVSGGVGGGGAICGDVDPVDAPTGTCAIYINRINSTLWYWDNTLTTWILFG